MKRINLLYLALLPLGYLLFQISMSLKGENVFFYGFAENKETELNHESPVLIQAIHVKPGQQVEAGELLMTVNRPELDRQMQNTANEQQEWQAAAELRRQNLESEIQGLKAQKESLRQELQAEISNLELSLQTDQALLKDLQGFDSLSRQQQNAPKALKLANLKERLQLSLAPIDAELQGLEKELRGIQNLHQLKAQDISQKAAHYSSQKETLLIRAPSDGLVGNIHCREGEHIPAFSTLISFYERNPTLVKGFVHESLIVEVRIGDSLHVASSLLPGEEVRGRIVGLGSRIVEIPERLRKIPDVKMYGREVLIEIPANNPFLQKEKVYLNAVGGSTTASIFSGLFSFRKKRSGQDRWQGNLSTQ